MNRWLSRFAFTFLILGGLLIWQAHREWNTLAAPSKARIALYLVAAGVSIGLGVRGIKERHGSAGD